MNMPKRRKAGDDDESNSATPRKSRKTVEERDEAIKDTTPAETPSKRKSILKETPSKLNGIRSVEATPTSLRRVLFTTPSKPEEQLENVDEETPTATRNDRSARRKSQKTLANLLHESNDSDEDADEQKEAIANAVLEEEGEANEENEDADIEVRPSATPTKTGRPRGRPKGRRRERTPSPPPDLPPHELYFFQNRTGTNKTSSNIFPSHALLSREDYFAQAKDYVDPHAADIDRLKQLHKRAFDQWIFELHEGFNLCLYGYGSKRSLAMDFIEHVYYQEEKPPKIVVTNGYTPGITIKDILSCLASAFLPKTAKLPAQPSALLEYLLDSLSETTLKNRIVLVVHSLDHFNLRKPSVQVMLARLAAHDKLWFVATCDTPNFPLLWDIGLSRQFRFLYHDATTFEPWKAEMDVVEDVNILLGRSRRSLTGKDGIAYVLKSLPENARNLFRILVAEQLALADMDGDAHFGPPGDESDPEDIIGVDDEEEAAAQQHTPSKRGRGRPKKVVHVPKPTISASIGVEYRTLYHKAVEEFVCSSELNFRTLLKEFYDHQMVESRKDLAGTERLLVPFKKQELETILEELV